MKVSVDWINHFLSKKLSVGDMAAAMELAAIEVEEVLEPAPLGDDVVVGRVADVQKHPNADKLRLAKVDVGEVLNIVCGAPNLEKGQLVAVARVGAELPGGIKITEVKIRGQQSMGMICSQRELGLGSEHEGIMVIQEGNIGQKVNEIITTNSTIHIKTAANRWDLTSVIGIARELAAQTNQKMSQGYIESINNLTFVSTGASISKNDLASRYMLARLKVNVARQSPKWLVDRLSASSIRAVNAVVDITNYIMLEYGQPLHAFDAFKVKGDVQVRNAMQDETLVTLDGVKRQLNSADIVIADEEQAIGFAGVMGGKNSEVDETTKEILLESACFNGSSLRKTAVRHALRTEASSRFERKIPAEASEFALKAAIKLLKQYADASLIGPITDIAGSLPARDVITARPDGISKILGLELSQEEIVSILNRLDFKSELKAGTLNVQVPWWRPDVVQEVDVAEEVIKLIGYDRLPATIPAWRSHKITFDKEWNDLWTAKSTLRSLDLFEVTTYSFISGKQIKDLGRDPKDFYQLENPMSIEQAYLRESMLPSLLSTASKNRNYSRRYGMFEFSKTFSKTSKGQLPKEVKALGVLIVVPDGGYAMAKASLDRLSSEFNADIRVEPGSFDADSAHPTRSGRIFAGNDLIGVIGQLHPELIKAHKIAGEVGYLELDWDAFITCKRPKQERPISPYPVIGRDITILVGSSVTWQEVKDALSDYRVKFVGDFYGHDLPGGHKAITIHITIERFDRTPRDDDAQVVQNQVVKILQSKFKAEIR